MAIGDLIGRIYGATFLKQFYQNNVWVPLVMDLSAEVPYGDRIFVPVDEDAYTPTTITAANAQGTTVANLKWADPSVNNPTSVELVINKYYEFNRLVSTVHARQVRPSLIDSAVELSVRGYMQQLNADLRGAVNAVAAAQTVTTLTTTAANWGNAAHQTAVYNAIESASKAADYAHWPMMGRYAVVSPSTKKVILDKIKAEKWFLVTGVTDVAVRDNMVARLEGFDIFVDDSMPSAETASTDNHWMYFGVRGQGVAFAQQLRGVRMIQNSEVYKGSLIQGEAAWGTIITQAQKIRVVKQTIT